MSEDFVVHMFREAFYTALLISAPVLLSSLLVGLFISVVQAATSVQEFTLTFVPKIVVVAVVLVLFLPWMIDTMVTFTLGMFQQLPGTGPVTMEIYVSQFVIFLLLFVRITALIVTAPVLGYQAVAVQVKVALGLFLALVFYPMVSAHAGGIDTRVIPLMIVALKEASVGLLLGFVLSLLLAGARFAGDIIGFDMGLSMANMIDPESEQSVSLIAEFIYMVSMLLFLLLNGHHFVIEALQLSYTTVPIGGLSVNMLLGEGVIKLTGLVFLIAVKLAAPIVVALFLVDVGLGVLARVVPQMNIFMLSFPLKIGIGLVMLMAMGPMMIYVFKKLLLGFENDVLAIVKVL